MRSVSSGGGVRKEIENIHGSCDTNFMELPSYMRELQSRNKGTVVQWLHHPHGTSQCRNFKYVFWAFKLSIDAFHLCQPVISVEETHLKGPYRSKLLIVVSKNANNYILPVAYAIVDEETTESWSWFLKRFRDHVADDRMGPMCFLSDRHKGIIHAMTNMDDWKEPNAYIIHAEIANNCNTALPPCMWRVFNKCDGLRKITKFSCMITSRMETNDDVLLVVTEMDCHMKLSMLDSIHLHIDNSMVVIITHYATRLFRQMQVGEYKETRQKLQHYEDGGVREESTMKWTSTGTTCSTYPVYEPLGINSHCPEGQ
ncbi:hypothetical protein E3N88_25585 [Mikania micrantha]|uniref:MULE transposase domain-containing protein n=1 Tax=Mikania micrantha TaxID=192012 RepID=A0A5N6N5J7_9ASTR|nr:hypothetical protein E3N88_25585 [Mikania micrantha]